MALVRSHGRALTVQVIAFGSALDHDPDTVLARITPLGQAAAAAV